VPGQIHLPGFGQGLHPLRQAHGVSDGGVGESVGGGDVADDHLAASCIWSKAMT
jgi:hypothetical protein